MLSHDFYEPLRDVRRDAAGVVLRAEERSPVGVDEEPNEIPKDRVGLLAPRFEVDEIARGRHGHDEPTFRISERDRGTLRHAVAARVRSVTT